MYNEEQKLKFLSDKSETTQRQYKIFYEKTEPFEHKFNKDICDLSLDEILSTITEIRPKNDKQAKVYCAMINGYYRWKYKTDDNLFKEVESEFYNQFI